MSRFCPNISVVVWETGFAFGRWAGDVLLTCVTTDVVSTMGDESSFCIVSKFRLFSCT